MVLLAGNAHPFGWFDPPSLSRLKWEARPPSAARGVVGFFHHRLRLLWALVLIVLLGIRLVPAVVLFEIIGLATL